MRSVIVMVGQHPAGILAIDREGGYRFRYCPEFVRSEQTFPMAITFPKRSRTFRSAFLFPFFFGLLPEGEAARVSCLRLGVAETDYLSRLVDLSAGDSVGDVVVKER